MRSQLSDTIRTRGGRMVDEMSQHLGMEAAPSTPGSRVS
jgi:hypothetical protein